MSFAVDLQKGLLYEARYVTAQERRGALLPTSSEHGGRSQFNRPIDEMDVC